MTAKKALLVILCLPFLLLLWGCETKKKSVSPRTRTVTTTNKGGAPKKPAVKKPTPKKPAVKKPKKAAHPDYPTPRLAESEAIFLLEEPERGPLVTSATIPSKKGIKWTAHTHCAIGIDRVDCGPPLGPRSASGSHWRVGRRKGLQVMAEERFGQRLIRTLILDHGKGGRPLRVTLISGRGVVRWSRHFNIKGEQYSARRRDGSNALSGCGHMAMGWDRRRRVNSTTCMQWTAGVMKDTRGVVKTSFKRNRRGLELERRRWDESGEPMVGHDGYHRLLTKRDAQGRPVELSYQDAQGMAAMAAATGCHGWRYEYDGRGLKVKKFCLGVEGAPAPDNQGVCGYQRSHDGRGCLIQQVNLVLTKGRCVKKSKLFDYEVDKHCGRLRKVCRKPGSKRATCGNKQPAEFRYTRDDEGRITSTKHFRPDRQPGKDTSCLAYEIRIGYDEQGNEATRSWFGANGKPMDCWRTGFHFSRMKYDDAGRITEKRFFDARGASTTNLGCALRKYSYDNYDHTVETEDRDKAGALSADLGMARKRYIYDSGHRNFGQILFNAKGEPAKYRGCFSGQRCTSKAWHALRIMRRPNGSVAENLFFDRDGQLIDTINCKKELCWK